MEINFLALAGTFVVTFAANCLSDVVRDILHKK